MNYFVRLTGISFDDRYTNLAIIPTATLTQKIQEMNNRDNYTGGSKLATSSDI